MIDPTFTELGIGPVRLPNRLALAPVKTALGTADGRATADHVTYYRRRAVGGAGLIIVEPMAVDPAGREHPKQLGIHDDDLVPALRAVVDAIHCSGSIAFAHLNHAGRAANPKATGRLPEAPSSVACPSTGATPEPMSVGRIQQVVGAYTSAARRAVEAGFDGVELQLGLGYLPAQFLSPRTNLRDDSYGGDGGRRRRFVHELVAAVRDALGDSRALVVRLSADERVDGGLGLDDGLELARRARDWGADGLHVVTGSACDSPPWYYQHMALPAGVNESLTATIRREVSLPVLVAGRLGDPARIREILADGMADAVALGRPLVADPDLPRKMASGRDAEIMSCGACLQGCLAEVRSGRPIGCIVNPDVLGDETALPAPQTVRERVVVVGGGPAGLQAALTASRHGARVTLLERRPSLGGLFNLAPLTPGKRAMERPLRSLVGAVERAPIDVRTGCEATVGVIREMAPDRVVVATGSEPVVPEIAGLHDPLTAEDVLTGRREAGPNVLVLGGGLVGIEATEMLAGRGHRVVVVEMLDDIARDMEAVTRTMTLGRLAALPVTVHTSTRLVRLDGRRAVLAKDGVAGELVEEPVDSVLVAVGHRSLHELPEELEHAGIPMTVAGDAVRPGQILDATRSGFGAASATVRADGGLRRAPQ